MSLKVSVVVQNEFLYEQIKQMLQDMDVYYVENNEDYDVLITDGVDKIVYEPKKDELHTIFSIVEEKPEDVLETPQCRFYLRGKVGIEQFVSDLKCWESVYETIRGLNDCAQELEANLEDVQLRYQEHEMLMNQATDWQKKAMLPELGSEFLYSLRYQAALFASGDFLCTKNFEESTFFIIADVSGHGVSDALVGASFKGMIDTYIELNGPETKLDNLISYIQKHKDCFYEKNFPEEEVFPYSVHILAAKLNKKEYAMDMCSVGYGDAPPIFISGNNVQVYNEAKTNVIPPIGEYDMTPVITTIPFHPGDGIILCSDGYTEAFVSMDRQDKRYEYKPKRLAESARRAVLHNRNWHPDEVADEIDSDLTHYIQSALSEKQRKSHDDTSLLVVKWNKTE